MGWGRRFHGYAIAPSDNGPRFVASVRLERANSATRRHRSPTDWPIYLVMTPFHGRPATRSSSSSESNARSAPQNTKVSPVFTPRDSDVSPDFDVAKSMIEPEFDWHALIWEAASLGRCASHRWKWPSAVTPWWPSHAETDGAGRQRIDFAGTEWNRRNRHSRSQPSAKRQ